MTINEYIAALQALKAEHGDVSVMRNDGGPARNAPVPVIGYLLRNWEHAFFYQPHQSESMMGEKVVRI
jgi:hypothetical protein